MKPDKDLIVIGAGGAGLTAAQYGARANLRTLLIEELAMGGQALLIEGLENYPGFPEPINGLEFSERMERQARQFGTEFLSASCTSVKKAGDLFLVETSQGLISSYAVILCTGARHRLLDVPGEKEYSGRGVSYCATCDGPFFRKQSMVVVGGGDAACDEAMFLAKLSDRILMVHRRDRFRAQKALAERVLRNPNITVRFNTVIREIRGVKNAMGMDKVASVVLEDVSSGERREEQTAAVFVFVGSIPATSLAPELPMDEAGNIITDQRMASALPGLFCAGDVRSTPFRQLVVAAGEGAIAAHSAAQYIDEIQGQAY
jgi:thioredoxin reductase (NADPH)